MTKKTEKINRDTSDLWKTIDALEASEKYNLDEFYCRGSDKRGHSGQIALRIPPDVYGVIDTLFQTRKFPYKTLQDLIRDAIVHRAYHLRSQLQDDKVDQQFIQILNLQNMLLREEHALEYAEVFKKLENIVQSYTQDGYAGFNQAKKIVRESLEYAEAMTDSYWKNRFMTEIKDKYARYLVPGAKP